MLGAEIMWLLVSTTLLIIAAVRTPGYWPLLWLAILLVNAAVDGSRVRRMVRQLRADSLVRRSRSGQQQAARCPKAAH